MITVYSLCWTIINCTLMAFVIFALRRRTALLTKYGTFGLRFLVLCCIARVLLPIEFPNHQYILISGIFSWIFEKFKFLFYPDFQRSLLMWIMIIWITGSVIKAFRLYKKSSKVRKAIDKKLCANSVQAAKILETIDSSGKLSIFVSKGISVPVLVGYFHPAIYLPEYSYTDKELRYIILHEYTHWKRKDLIKKFFMHVICVIIWWNPAVYIIRSELSRLIEFNCDKQLSGNLSEEDMFDYLDVLWVSFKRARNPEIKTNLYTVEFVNTAPRYTIQQRFDLLLERNAEAKRLLPKLAVVLFGVLWLFASYYFILQTSYSFTGDLVQEDDIKTQTVSDASSKENAYLEEQEDGTYIFYYNGISIDVPMEDVDKGLYRYYDIIEYKDEESILMKVYSKIKSWINE